MNKNLLIVGAGIYGLVAQDIAESTGTFDRIAFVDDHAAATANGMAVKGTTRDLPFLSGEYSSVVVAIGAPSVRLHLLDQIRRETHLQIVTLISPCAYVSPTAEIGEGSIVEPLAVVHTNCVLERGCIVSAGAVVNHASRCCAGVHVDCNAVVAGNVMVPQGTKVPAGMVYYGKSFHTPETVAGRVYCFEDGM